MDARSSSYSHLTRLLPQIVAGLFLITFSEACNDKTPTRSIPELTTSPEPTANNIDEPPGKNAQMWIDFSELDRFLHKNRHLFNRSAVVIRQNGRVVYTYGDADSPVYAASCSKWLSAATIMRLVEKKQLQLDAPAATYMRKLRTRARALTLRKLLSHTAGLRPNGNGHDTVPLRRTATPRLHFLKEQTPTFCYENAGINFAGKLSTKATHKKWSHLFRDEIGAPLGLNNAYFRKSKPTAAAGAVISAADYSKFLEMIRRDGLSIDNFRVLSKSSVREMLQNHTQGLPMQCIPRPSKRKESHGLGVWRQGQGELPDLASHFGASGYKVFIDFCRDVTAVFALEHKPKKQNHAKDVTRNIFDIVQRVIPINDTCFRAGDTDTEHWRMPLRPPAIPNAVDTPPNQ